MAFQSLNLDRLSVQSIYEVFRYKTLDSKSAVKADGYFHVDKFNLKNSTAPIVECICGDGTLVLSVDEITGKSSVLMESQNSSSSKNSLYANEVIIQSPSDLNTTIDPTKMYVIDGIIDLTGTGISIEIPDGGMNMRGLGLGVSGIVCSDDNYTMFTSPVGGSGTIFGTQYYITTSGANSQVYDLTDANGFNAFEFNAVNYIDCTSLGEINGYRQGLEVGTGRLGGTPELTLSGSWGGGYRISTSIAFNMSSFTSLFKAGTGFVYGGRFITDINCNMPATGALIDFSPSNVTNDESLILDGAYVQRQGVLDASDTTLYPNIDHTSVKSNWGNNTGLPNTQKYIKTVCTAEVVTNIASASTYYPLAGTMTVSDSVQFDAPVNGQIRLLTGNGLYDISGTIQIKGNAGDSVDIQVTRSTDGGSTFPEVINHIGLEIANLAGPNDFATYSINFSSSLKKNDRIRLEVENLTAARNVTMGAESFMIVTEV